MSASSRNNLLQILKWLPVIIFPGVIIYFSYRMTLLSIPYLEMKPDVEFLRQKNNVYHIAYWRIGFYAHVFTSVFVLLAGATQFTRVVLTRYPTWHRIMGYSYILIILLVSGPGAMAMALHANGGLPAKASFVLQTTMWFIFTGAAWYYALKRKWVKHGEFILLSYSLTFAAITLRVLKYLLSVLITAGYIKVIRPVDSYITVAWLSWVPNVIIAAMMIHLGFIRWFIKKRT